MVEFFEFYLQKNIGCPILKFVVTVNLTTKLGQHIEGEVLRHKDKEKTPQNITSKNQKTFELQKTYFIKKITEILIFCYDETSRTLLLKQWVDISNAEKDAFNVTSGMTFQCKLYCMKTQPYALFKDLRQTLTNRNLCLVNLEHVVEWSVSETSKLETVAYGLALIPSIHEACEGFLFIIL